jgi:8-oxo-dGTP diphosphatase / 2-hydroxy-dATP diphosphatase
MSVLPPKLLTLVFVLGRRRVLLGMKKRGFGAGNWNGFGGKKEPGESLRCCARRELMEESGLTAPEEAFRERGFLSFLMESDGMQDVSGAVSKVLHVFVYSVAEESCTGEPTESEEMRPQWYAIGDVPYENMWLDDKVWLPHLLEDDTGELCINADFTFESKGQLRDDWKLWKWPSSSLMLAAFELEAEQGDPGSGGAPAECGAGLDGTCPHDRIMGDVVQLLWPDSATATPTADGLVVQGTQITATRGDTEGGAE